MALHRFVFLILFFISSLAGAESKKPISISIHATHGEVDTTYEISCGEKDCRLGKSNAREKKSRAIECEDAEFFLTEIQRLPQAKKAPKCGRISMTIVVEGRAPLEDCLDEKTLSGQAFARFLRGIDAAL